MFNEVLSGEIQGKLVVGDCLDITKRLPSGCLDLVFADPPFNTGKDYGFGFDDNKDTEEYFAWLFCRIEDQIRLLKPGGTLWLMNSSRNIGRCQVMLDDLGLTFRNMICWAYAAPTPAKKRLPKTWRPILFYSKGKVVHFYPNKTWLGKPTLYHNPLRAKSHPVHDLWPDIPKLVGGYLAQKELVRNPDGTFFLSVQMPEGIAKRIILLASDGDCIVGDFFCGVGTFLTVAKRYGRKFVGCDINYDYVELARERIEKGRTERAGMLFNVYEQENLFV